MRFSVRGGGQADSRHRASGVSSTGQPKARTRRRRLSSRSCRSLLILPMSSNPLRRIIRKARDPPPRSNTSPWTGPALLATPAATWTGAVPFVDAIWFFALGADPETGGAVATDMLPCFDALAGGKVASATTPRITDVGESTVESAACPLAEGGALAGAESSFLTSTCAQKADLSTSPGNITAAWMHRHVPA